MTQRILIVDDDADVLRAGRLALRKDFAEIRTCDDPAAIPGLLARERFDAILLDMNFTPGEQSGEQGLGHLKRILAIDPLASVIMVTAFSTVDAAVKAMKLGAADFVEKPWSNARLVSTVRSAARLYQARRAADTEQQRSQLQHEEKVRRTLPIIGNSPALLAALDLVERAAPTEANVLVLGENGTGKELICEALHARSQRAHGPLISIDLGAVPEALLESELFGHTRGAFTDARAARMGRFQAANGGTLFLDEIGNMPLHLQPKLLRVLEERTVTPVGSDRVEPLDIRLISATNRPPEALAAAEGFRRDLLYRLNTVEIRLPPLRERTGDIPLLAEAFTQKFAQKYHRPVHSLTDAALERLAGWDWPGNVRELRHCIERAVILADGEQLDADAFAFLAPAPAAPRARAQRRTLGEVEADSIRDALKTSNGNVSRAARALGLSRAALYRRMSKHGI